MAGLGYRLPGTRIEEVTQPSSVNISSSQRTPVFIGMASDYIYVNYEEVTRSTPGLIDNLLYTTAGIHAVTQIGSQRGLNDYVSPADYSLTGDQIVWTSAGVITAGAIYYVSYEYDRPYDAGHLTDTTLNDYRYKEFSNYNDVVADLGDNIPANTLVMIANLALNVFNVPKIATYQLRSNTYSEYLVALNAIKYRDVQTVIPLSSASNVRSAVATHVTERSLPDNGRFRMAWFGAPTGTAVGTDSDPTSLRGMAQALQNELCVMINATRAKYYYNDPDTKEEFTTVVDGSFIAATIAAYCDSFSYPAQNLLNKTITGVELYDEDYDDYYSEFQLTLCGGSSVFLVESLNGTLRVVDDLTTDNSTVERNNINIITAKHYIAKDVIAQMNRTFRGRLITNAGNFSANVKSYLAAMFAAYKNANIIESIGTITASVHPTRRDTINIFYSYRAVYTAKYFEGTYALTV